jgi:hypothetical protein
MMALSRSWWSVALLAAAYAAGGAGGDGCGGAKNADALNNNSNAGSVAIQVDLSFPDQASFQATHKLLVVVTSPDASGAPCSASNGGVFDYTNGLPAEAAETLLDFPGGSDRLLTPSGSGNYAVYVYAYSVAIDRFCSADEDCKGSSAGSNCGQIGFDLDSCSANGGKTLPSFAGCTTTMLSTTVSNEFKVTLDVMH